MLERQILPNLLGMASESNWSSSKSQGKYSDHSESEIGPVSGLSPDRCNILGLSVKVVWWWEVDPTWLEKGLP